MCWVALKHYGRFPALPRWFLAPLRAVHSSAAAQQKSAAPSVGAALFVGALAAGPVLAGLVQHLDDAREILATVPGNAVRGVDRTGHAPQWGAGLDGGGVFLRQA